MHDNVILHRNARALSHSAGVHHVFLFTTLSHIGRYSQYSSLHYRRASMNRGQTANDLNFYSLRIKCLYSVATVCGNSTSSQPVAGKPSKYPTQTYSFKFRTFSVAIFFTTFGGQLKIIQETTKLSESKMGTPDKACICTYLWNNVIQRCVNFTSR